MKNNKVKIGIGFGLSFAAGYAYGMTHPYAKDVGHVTIPPPPVVEEDDYGIDTYVFESRDSAVMVYEELENIAKRNGVVSVEEYLDILGEASGYSDMKYGWTVEDLKSVKFLVTDRQLRFMMELPKPRLLKNLGR